MNAHEKKNSEHGLESRSQYHEQVVAPVNNGGSGRSVRPRKRPAKYNDYIPWDFVELDSDPESLVGLGGLEEEDILVEVVEEEEDSMVEGQPVVEVVEEEEDSLVGEDNYNLVEVVEDNFSLVEVAEEDEDSLVEEEGWKNLFSMIGNG